MTTHKFNNSNEGGKYPNQTPGGRQPATKIKQSMETSRKTFKPKNTHH